MEHNISGYGEVTMINGDAGTSSSDVSKGDDFLNNVTFPYGNETICHNNIAANCRPQDEVHTPTYYSINYQVIGVIFATIIFTVGLIGNLMVIVVVSKTKTMRTPTNFYLVSLSAADIIVLFTATLPLIPELFIDTQEWIYGQVGCSLLIFLQYLGVNASAVSITSFTIERYIGICHPMRAQTICTVKRAKRIILGLWVFSGLYNSVWLFLTTLVKIPGTQKYACRYKIDRHMYVYIYMADMIIFYVIPLILTCVLYGLIASILFSGPTISSNKTNQTSNSRKQVVKMLIVVVGLFAVLWLPYRVLVVYNSFATVRFMDPWYIMFCRIMVYINSAINPILYNAMSVKFRRAFKNLLSCRRPKRHSITDDTRNKTNCLLVKMKSAGTTSTNMSKDPIYLDADRSHHEKEIYSDSNDSSKPIIERTTNGQLALETTHL